MVVWGVGEYEVERRVACRDVAEYIATYDGEAVSAEFVFYTAYESQLSGSLFHYCHFIAAARQEFKAYGAGASEEVESRASVKVVGVLKHIKQIFACEVGSGACRYVLWDIEASTAVFSSYYSHVGLFHS